MTLGELRLGVVSATDPDISGRRLATYEIARRFEPIPIDERVNEQWAVLVARLRAGGRRVPINDSWIAATALAYNLPIATQDADYDAMPGVTAIKL